MTTRIPKWDGRECQYIMLGLPSAGVWVIKKVPYSKWTWLNDNLGSQPCFGKDANQWECHESPMASHHFGVANYKPCIIVYSFSWNIHVVVGEGHDHCFCRKGIRGGVQEGFERHGYFLFYKWLLRSLGCYNLQSLLSYIQDSAMLPAKRSYVPDFIANPGYLPPILICARQVVSKATKYLRMDCGSCRMMLRHVSLFKDGPCHWPGAPDG